MHKTTYLFILVCQLWIKFCFCSYLKCFTTEGQAVDENARYTFVQNFFQIDAYRAYYSKLYVDIIEMGIEYLEDKRLRDFKKKMEGAIAQKPRVKVVNILLRLHYEVSHELNLPPYALTTWSQRASINEKKLFKFVQSLFELEHVKNQKYMVKIQQLIHKTVEYIKAEARSKKETIVELGEAKKDLISSLKLLYGSIISKKSTFAMFAIYQALLSSSEHGNAELATPNAHPLLLDAGVQVDNEFTTDNNDCTLLSIVRDQSSPSSCESAGSEPNQTEPVGSYEDQSLLEKFNYGKRLSRNDKNKFVQNFFRLKPGTTSATVRSYNDTIKLGVNYLETSNFEEFRKGLESIIERDFSKRIINIFLQLHYEVCNQLKLPSSTLERWNKRTTINTKYLLEFVRNMFKCKCIYDPNDQTRVGQLIRKTAKYIRLEVSSKGKMTEKLENARNKLIKALKLYYSFRLPTKPRLAMFVVCQELISNSATGCQPLLPLDEGAVEEKHSLTEPLILILPNPSKYIQFEQTQNTINQPLNSGPANLFTDALGDLGSFPTPAATTIDEFLDTGIWDYNGEGLESAYTLQSPEELDLTNFENTDGGGNNSPPSINNADSLIPPEILYDHIMLKSSQQFLDWELDSIAQYGTNQFDYTFEPEPELFLS